MDRIKLLWSKTNRWHRGILLFIILELQILPKGQLGFTCNDPALSHPFTGDTISWKQLLAAVMFFPLAVMLLVERMNQTETSLKPKQRALRWYREYLFGVLLNLLVVQGLKLIVGSPRPHFFDTCKPVEAASCESGQFVSSYSCTKAHWLSQSDRSFPSGHTSLAVHGGLFLIYYLWARARASRATRASQFALATLASACGASRVWDRRHHWWDVLAGALLAAPILLYTIVYLCKNFETPPKVKENSSDNESNFNSNKDQLNSKLVEGN